MFKRIIVRTLTLTCITFLFIFLLVARPLYVFQENDVTDDFVSAEKLKDHVIFLSETISPRDSEHPENLDKAADYIQEQLMLSSADVTFQNYSVDGQNYKNVIAQYGPANNESIIIGAHYDVFSTLPGADDNASGIAGLIELGALLQSQSLNHRVILIAYSLEEPPHFATKSMGSYVHAESVKNQNVKLMISLEMIGYFSEQSPQNYPVSLMSFYYPNKGNFIAIVDKLSTNNAIGLKSTINQYTNLPAYSINAPQSIPGIDYSDHRNYWAFDIPAVMVTDTSFYRNTAYHTPEDTYDRLNYDAMAQVVFGVFKYIRKIQ